MGALYRVTNSSPAATLLRFPFGRLTACPRRNSVRRPRCWPPSNGLIEYTSSSPRPNKSPRASQLAGLVKVAPPTKPVAGSTEGATLGGTPPTCLWSVAPRRSVPWRLPRPAPGRHLPTRPTPPEMSRFGIAFNPLLRCAIVCKCSTSGNALRDAYSNLVLGRTLPDVYLRLDYLIHDVWDAPALSIGISRMRVPVA